MEEEQKILFVAIAKVITKKVIFQYLPNKKQRKNAELVFFLLAKFNFLVWG